MTHCQSCPGGLERLRKDVRMIRRRKGVWEMGKRSCRTQLEKWRVGSEAQTKGATFEKMNMKQRIFLQWASAFPVIRKEFLTCGSLWRQSCTFPEFAFSSPPLWMFSIRLLLARCPGSGCCRWWWWVGEVGGWVGVWVGSLLVLKASKDGPANLSSSIWLGCDSAPCLCVHSQMAASASGAGKLKSLGCLRSSV